jgi:hypothetical protein
MECGGHSKVVCASEECVNYPCERHSQRCPICQKEFCASSKQPFETCFSEHVRQGTCEQELLRVPMTSLNDALRSGQHRELDDFLNCNSDGLGHPLPREVCTNFGLAVAYLKNLIPEYNRDVVVAQTLGRRAQRRNQQKFRRAAKSLNLKVCTPSCSSPRLARYRNSTIHVATGALVVRHWTNRWHYRKQIEILQIMGLHKGEDFIRDRVGYLYRSNPILFRQIELRATAITNRS